MKRRLSHFRGQLQAQNARAAWTTRECLVVEVVDGSRIGRGECAPLPGYSQESLEDCRHALESGGPLPPAAAFALWSAELELAGDCRPERRDPLPLAGLDEHEGAPVRKLKIGRNLERELDLARKHQGPLRLDANQTLDEASFLRVLKAGLPIEFIEEPLPFERLQASKEEWRSFDVPIALDESLQSPNGEERLRTALGEGWAQVAVLKPMALGPQKAARLANIAHEHGAPCIVSHLFEGPLGYAATALFAFQHASQHAQGLGRHAGLEAYAEWSTHLGSQFMLHPWDGKRWPIERR